jgi:Pyruvate/2-oxoacid:ferredoxin oxidoreductase delta subunit
MAILYCNCANAQVLSPEAKEAALRQLRESGEPFEVVADICELVAHGKFTANGPLKVYACHPRAVKSLLPTAVEVVDLRGQTAAATTPGAWFPVIDFDRCNHCMQCLSFCLFGVFAAKDGKIRVTQPDNCKPNCPACARVCPEAAIIFPKHPEPIIHGGDGQRAKVDVSALLGGDVYQTLRKRSRFDKDRDAATALAERRQHLARLQKELGIPPEVLRDL